MNEEKVVAWLREQTEKKLLQVVSRAVAGRSLHPLEAHYLESRLMLAHAWREKDVAHWTLELLGIPDDAEQWVDDAPICQTGDHCGWQMSSWAKRFRCPLCDSLEYGT